MTDNIILAQIFPERQPPKRRGNGGRVYGDPVKHLLAAVALKAVTDIVSPPRDLSYFDEYTARLFLEEHQSTFRALDIPQKKLDLLAAHLKEAQR